MEAFEQFVKVAMEYEDLVVSSGVKFPVARQTKRSDHPEFQTHGYEVDLVGARADRLVLATVKSFFGSLGVRSREVEGGGRAPWMYRLLNDPVIRRGVVAGAAKRYGFKVPQVEMRLYVGKWAHTRGIDERAATIAWCSRQKVGGRPIKVYDAADVVPVVQRAAESKTYINDAVIVTLKVLAEAESQLTILRRERHLAPIEAGSSQ